ncbi:hypothetical protein TRVL_09442 [Trypanosoma vivax]|nr:hypothetical protein TRVL_09442 [Trypanosoma vivax]
MSAADESFRREEVNGDTSGIFSIQIEPEPDVVRPPTYQLEDKVECVLMDGHVPPPDMKLSVFLRRIGLDIVPSVDESMRVVVLDPAEHIPDEEMRTAVLNAEEYMLYELRYVVVPFLWMNGVYIVQQWKEKRDDICSCEHEGVRDEIWNVAVGRLNAAVALVGLESDADREARVVSAKDQGTGTTGDWGNNCSWLFWLVSRYPGTVIIIYCAFLVGAVVLVSLVLWIR